MEELDRRIRKDRRRHPTPALSRYALWGERRKLRRKEDQKAGGYVDRYSPILLIFLISIMGLNILDAFQTIMLLDSGGWEVNPIVHSAMRLYGDNFWLWKFFIASACVVFLCLHSKFRKAKPIIVSVTILYLVLVFYHFLLISFCGTEASAGPLGGP